MQWRSKKEKRSAFGGHYAVWYKYYEKNLSGTSGKSEKIIANDNCKNSLYLPRIKMMNHR